VLVRALRVYRDVFDVVPVGVHATALERGGMLQRVVPQFG